MILRAFVLTLGLTGAFGAAQFPEYSQQYMQRLGGAVDALGVVVQDFDTSASAAGLTRSEALAQMHGTAFLERRQADMSRTIARHDKLESDLLTLQGLGPFMRAYHGARMTDREIAEGAWQAFRPAVPLNLASLIFAGFGFFSAVFAVWCFAALLRVARPRRSMPA